MPLTSPHVRNDVPTALNAIAYVSRAKEGLAPERVARIVTDATEFNRGNDISGALIFDGTCFFQYIEGRRVALADAYARIQASRSHVILLKLLEGPAPARRFEGWEMFYRDGMPSGIGGLNWAPGREPSGDFRRDLVASALAYFWRNFEAESLPTR